MDEIIERYIHLATHETQSPFVGMLLQSVQTEMDYEMDKEKYFRGVPGYAQPKLLWRKSDETS